MSLDRQIQSDWSGGIFSTPARELIPQNGFADCVNGLLEEDGTVYKRGGCAYKSNANVASDLTFLWDGYLTAGQRTAFASSTTFFALGNDDATPVTIGSVGTTGKKPAVGNGVLFLPVGGGSSIAVYGGSLKTANYTTGTASVTSGSDVVTGTGTSWSANTDAGMVITIGSFTGIIKAVVSNTQLQLTQNATATTSGAYTLAPVASLTPLSGFNADAIATISAPARLVIGSGNRVSFSGAGKPFTFAATDYHVLPAGATIVGMEALRHTLMVFTTAGIFTITGMDYDLTDAQGNIQQRVAHINQDVILLDQRGITGWHNALVVPATDDIYLVSDTAAPQSIGGSLKKAYRDYVKAGYTCGYSAVYRNHLFLPILSGTTWVDTLVCRLDQGGWTRWAGLAGQVCGFTTRTTSGARNPTLLAASTRRILNDSECFSPASTNKNDADATTPTFSIVTRDFTTGGMTKNLVKKIRLRYELTDAANDDPTIQAYYGTGAVNSTNPIWGSVTWGSFVWGSSSTEQFAQITGSAPEDNGTSPYVWPVRPTESGVRPRFIRFKFSSTTPCAKLVVRSLELFIRTGGRQ